jgi:hypothetical protein
VLHSSGQILQAAVALSKADEASNAALKREDEAAQLHVAAAHLSAQVDSVAGTSENPVKELEIQECIIEQVINGHRTHALIGVWNEQLSNALRLKSSLQQGKFSQDALVAELSESLRHHEKPFMHAKQTGTEPAHTQSDVRVHAAMKQLLVARSAAAFDAQSLQVCEAFIQRTQNALDSAQSQAQRLKLLQQQMAAECALLEAKEAASGRLQMLRSAIVSERGKSEDLCSDRDKENSSLLQQLREVSELAQALKEDGKHVESAAVLRRSIQALPKDADNEEAKKLPALHVLEAQAVKDLAMLEGEVMQASKLRHYMQAALWYASCSTVASSKSSAVQDRLEQVNFYQELALTPQASRANKTHV